jgi:hypothetical protein
MNLPPFAHPNSHMENRQSFFDTPAPRPAGDLFFLRSGTIYPLSGRPQATLFPL